MSLFFCSFLTFLNLSNNFNTEQWDALGFAIPFVGIFISIFVLPQQRNFSQDVPKGEWRVIWGCTYLYSLSTMTAQSLPRCGWDSHKMKTWHDVLARRTGQLTSRLAVFPASLHQVLRARHYCPGKQRMLLTTRKRWSCAAGGVRGVSVSWVPGLILRSRGYPWSSHWSQ